MLKLETDMKRWKDIPQNFKISKVFITTFLNVENPYNSNQHNNYQMIIAQGTESAAEKTVVMFNYHSIRWMPITFNVGFFVAAAENEQCHFFLDYQRNLRGSEYPRIKGGYKSVMIVGEEIECNYFESECGRVEGAMKTLPHIIPYVVGGMSLRGGESPDQWLFYKKDCEGMYGDHHCFAKYSRG